MVLRTCITTQTDVDGMVEIYRSGERTDVMVIVWLDAVGYRDDCSCR